MTVTTRIDQHVVIVFKEERIIQVLGPYNEGTADSLARTISNASITQAVEVHPVSRRILETAS